VLLCSCIRLVFDLALHLLAEVRQCVDGIQSQRSTQSAQTVAPPPCRLGNLSRSEAAEHAMRHCFGEGLSRFRPSYFKERFFRLRPDCNSWAAELEPWSERKLLRIVTDREKSANGMQSFLCSRLRALEVSDPCHILWRIAVLGVEHAGYKGAAATLTVAMNAWKGSLGCRTSGFCLC